MSQYIGLRMSDFWQTRSNRRHLVIYKIKPKMDRCNGVTHAQTQNIMSISEDDTALINMN